MLCSSATTPKNEQCLGRSGLQSPTGMTGNEQGELGIRIIIITHNQFFQMYSNLVALSEFNGGNVLNEL